MSPEGMNEKLSKALIPWFEIDKGLPELSPVEGGNTGAHKGIFIRPDGSKVFVKIGVSEHTKSWASKEIKAYAFLEESNYPYVPRLLSTNGDETGFAIDALVPEDGWDWTDTWSKERLDATLGATDALAAIQPNPKYHELSRPVITDADNGWAKLLASPEQQVSLAARLKDVSEFNVLDTLRTHAERTTVFRVRHDTLVHDDVRADNCPWNEGRAEVKLVDWNWLELGDRRIDLAASLVPVHKSGFDILQDHANRLDAEALHWMVGFWLESASKPIWPGGPEKLRETQLQAGIAALRLIEDLT